MYVASRNVDIDIGPEGAVCGHVIGAARGADVLSHECTFSNEEAEKAVVAMHSTAAMAGSFARHLGCAHSPCTRPHHWSQRTLEWLHPLSHSLPIPVLH